MQPVVYKPGSGLIARFDIVGYKTDGNNQYFVDYGISILGPANTHDGVAKTMFKQRRFCVVGNLNLTMRNLGLWRLWNQPGFLDVPLGDKLFVLDQRDKVGCAPPRKSGSHSKGSAKPRANREESPKRATMVRRRSVSCLPPFLASTPM